MTWHVMLAYMSCMLCNALLLCTMNDVNLLQEKPLGASTTCQSSSNLKDRWVQGAKDYTGRSAEGIMRGNNSRHGHMLHMEPL